MQQFFIYINTPSTGVIPNRSLAEIMAIGPDGKISGALPL
jgi:hypothetical protein